jgi:hypothetical protein
VRQFCTDLHLPKFLAWAEESLDVVDARRGWGPVVRSAYEGCDVPCPIVARLPDVLLRHLLDEPPRSEAMRRAVRADAMLLRRQIENKVRRRLGRVG